MFEKEEVAGNKNYGRNFNEMPVHFGVVFKTSAGMIFKYAAKLQVCEVKG